MSRRVHLRLIQVADFRRSEKTNFDLLSAAFKRSMKEHDVACFLSGSGDQIVFVSPPGEVTNSAGPIGFTASRRIRLDGRHRWNPEMLQNYAGRSGLELIGLPDFAEILQKRDEERRARRRTLAAQKRKPKKRK